MMGWKSLARETIYADVGRVFAMQVHFTQYICCYCFGDVTEIGLDTYNMKRAIVFARII